MSTLTATNEKKGYQLFGMPWYLFGTFAAIIILAAFLGKIPSGMIGAIPLMFVIGVILNEIGEKTPIVNSYLGGGAIVIIFGSAALCYFKVLNEASIAVVDTFMKGGGFLDFYIAALITGSILGMNRKLLIRAAIRYLPAIIGGVSCAMLLTGIVGALTGYGAKEAILYICVPIMGGGMGAGAVPLSKIFGESLGKDPGQMLSVMVPAVALGNAMAIIAGGLISRFGKGKPSLSGEGQLMIASGNEANALDADPEFQKARDFIVIKYMGIGLFLATGFFVFGGIVNKVIPSIHGYAWMIISVAVVKIFGLLPQKYEICCYQWYQFIVNNLTGVLLVGIGVSYTNLAEVAAAFSFEYLLLVTVTILGAILGAGFVGRLVGFFPVESAITAGLCMANMGGTGDVAVLSASNRMELMPFAQISSRIGGAFMLILASLLLQFIG